MVMLVSPAWRIGRNGLSRSRCGSWLRSGPRCWQPAADGAFQFRAGEPIVLESLHVFATGIDLSLFGLQQLEDANLHGVVLQLVLLNDLVTQGNDDPRVIFVEVARPEQVVTGTAQLGPHLHRHGCASE